MLSNDVKLIITASTTFSTIVTNGKYCFIVAVIKRSVLHINRPRVREIKGSVSSSFNSGTNVIIKENIIVCWSIIALYQK